MLEAVFLLEIQRLGGAENFPQARPVLPLQALVSNDRADEFSTAADQEALAQRLVDETVVGFLQQAHGNQGIEEDLAFVGHPAQRQADHLGLDRLAGMVEDLVRDCRVEDGRLAILVGEFH
ncbi:hypothetical protein D3C79_861880 [compost metagenome]